MKDNKLMNDQGEMQDDKDSMGESIDNKSNKTGSNQNDKSM
jgi:hypothetical protein